MMNQTTLGTLTNGEQFKFSDDPGAMWYIVVDKTDSQAMCKPAGCLAGLITAAYPWDHNKKVYTN